MILLAKKALFLLPNGPELMAPMNLTSLKASEINQRRDSEFATWDNDFATCLGPGTVFLLPRDSDSIT